MQSIKSILTAGLMSALLLVSGVSQAALLGLQIAYPQMNYTTSSTDIGATYDMNAATLTITSTPVFLTPTSSGSSSFISGGSMTLIANIDNAGLIYPGGTFEIKSGATVLLAGSVDDYGKSDSTSLIDFGLTVTSGTLAADFLAVNSSGETAAVMSLLSSTFTGFGSNWTAADAKGDIGPVPTIAELPAHTIGYWKNHPETWSSIILNICSNNMDQEELIGVLSTPVRGDKTISMAHQLIASSLNAIASSSCPAADQTIADSEAWLCSHGGIGSGLKQWDGGSALKDALDDFNNNGCI